MADERGNAFAPSDEEAVDASDLDLTLRMMTSVLPPPPAATATPRKPLPSLAEVRRSLPSLSEMRRSLVSLAEYRRVFRPRWMSWSAGRAVAATLAFGGVVALLVILFPDVQPAVERLVLSLRGAATAVAAVPVMAHISAAAPLPAPAPERRADANLFRENRSPVAGGLLIIPPAFASEDGGYNLFIHFHGNTNLVEESVIASKLNAVVVTMNLGVGSGPYESHFGVFNSLLELLSRVQGVMSKRGLAHPHLKKLALSAWSAGYGAVLKVLEQPAEAEQVDSVLLLDGIHVGYIPPTTNLWLVRLAPFERFAREAIAGKKLFSITHSDITPNGAYAGTRETTDALLNAVHVTRAPGGEAPAMPALRAMDGVMPKRKMNSLEAASVAQEGGFRVRGYRGDQPEHHVMHLVQMSTTALPDLVAHWTAKPSANPQ